MYQISVTLFEVHSKFILYPWIDLRTFLAGVHVSLSPQISAEELADPGDVAGLVLRSHGVVTGVPGQEALHLTLWCGVLHPLNHLPVGDNPHILPLDHVVQELTEGSSIFGFFEPECVEI